MSSDGEMDAIENYDRAGKIDRVVTSLMELFGERALEVSERQISMGNIQSVSDVWQEISDNIRHRSVDRQLMDLLVHAERRPQGAE